MTRSKAIGRLKNIAIYSVQDGYTDEARQALDMAIKALEEPHRKKGKWNRISGRLGNEVECSNCHDVFWIWMHNYSYCPSCGADMRGERDET